MIVRLKNRPVRIGALFTKKAQERFKYRDCSNSLVLAVKPNKPSFDIWHSTAREYGCKTPGLCTPCFGGVRRPWHGKATSSIGWEGRPKLRLDSPEIETEIFPSSNTETKVGRRSLLRKVSMCRRIITSDSEHVRNRKFSSRPATES